jgi:amidohydrolase
MPIIAEVLDYRDELIAIRRDIHAHPELAFAEQRTSDLVAAKLSEYGCEVYRGLAGTGVVGTIRRGNTPAAIGLRADMDALPIQEMNDFAYRSTLDGRMHACGHDGHTTMLLGAAKYLAATRNFEGTVHLIFQPAEEGGGGGRVMVEEGLFDKFPCDAVFALHNKPGVAVGAIAARPGPRHPCGASASRHRPFCDRRANRAGTPDDRQPQRRPARICGRQRRLHAGRLGL